MVVVRVVFSKIVSYILHARFPEDVGVPLLSAVLWVGCAVDDPTCCRVICYNGCGWLFVHYLCYDCTEGSDLLPINKYPPSFTSVADTRIFLIVVHLTWSELLCGWMLSGIFVVVLVFKA